MENISEAEAKVLAERDRRLNEELERGVERFDQTVNFLHANDINFSDIHLKEGMETVLRTNKGFGRISDLLADFELPEILTETWTNGNFMGFVFAYRRILLTDSGLIDDSVSFPSAQRILLEKMRNNGGALDFPVADDYSRYRINMFTWGGNQQLALVARKLNSTIPTFDMLNLPAVLKDVCTRDKGLILVTGATGSGKSTTLAAMLDHINEHIGGNIITIEDPIEYVHNSKRALFTHREVGTDTSSFEKGVVAAMREDPDVILIGEIRDRETAEAALSAASTGHLVFATLHTNSAASTCDRLLSFFPSDEKDRICLTLGANLLCVSAQALAPRQDGEGKVLVCEIMIQNEEIKNTIRKQKFQQLENAIIQGRAEGMQLFNDELQELVSQGVISTETAFNMTGNPEDLDERLNPSY